MILSKRAFKKTCLLIVGSVHIKKNNLAPQSRLLMNHPKNLRPTPLVQAANQCKWLCFYACATVLLGQRILEAALLYNNRDPDDDLPTMWTSFKAVRLLAWRRLLVSAVWSSQGQRMRSHRRQHEDLHRRGRTDETDAYGRNRKQVHFRKQRQF